MERPSPEMMEDMLADLRGALAASPVVFADRLLVLMDALRGRDLGPRDQQKMVRSPHPEAFASMLAELNAPLSAIETMGSPWAAAGLRRDELRNSSVLAWYLDPKSGHGLGDAPLRALLARISRTVSAFPSIPSRSCIVMVEDCPDGLRTSRVDVTVDDPGRFFLGIEIKIDAPEQPGQLERYCRIAEARACDGRPWAVAFLTRSGKLPTTAGGAGNIVPISWTAVAADLRTAAAPARSEGRITAAHHLAIEFASHISKF